MLRPSSTACTRVPKLSSVRIIRAACLETSLPLPIATPMSACFSAAASLTASPVIATIMPSLCIDLGQPQLVLRRDPAEHVQARAAAGAARRRRCACSSAPLIAPAPRPSVSPIACAVTAWSPVIIRTSMPARSAISTAAFADGRSGSMMPTIPTKPRSGGERHRIASASAGIVVVGHQPRGEGQHPQALLAHVRGWLPRCRSRSCSIGDLRRPRNGPPACCTGPAPRPGRP